MRAIQWDEFWWNNITGPHTVVVNVVTALLENKMVIIRVPSDLPWRHSMRSEIYRNFTERSSFRNIVIEPIDVSDDNPDDMEPGRYILERFASSTVKRGYREKSKVSIQDYISAKNVIQNRVIWIKGLNKKTTEQWINFCRGFSKRSVAEGLLVLEVHGDALTFESGHLKVIDFSEFVSSYDVQLFNSFVLDEQHCYRDNWKKYISTCSAFVCDIDAEISEFLIRIVDFRKESVVDGIKRIVEMPDFLRRGENGCSNHVLWNYRNGNFSELEHRIWSAQIQVLFPVIELERVSMIHKYEKEIQEILENETITQYNEILKNALDVELGTLCYLMSRKNYDGFYSLYIPNETDREWIRFLHDCRNKLAHVSCCSPEQIYALLNKMN